MNKAQLVGRLTKDPELKFTSNQTKFCHFTLAVDRRYKDANGQRQTDFITCVAWRQTADFIQKYFTKGSRIGVCGSIQTRNYEDNNGQQRTATEVIVDEVEFVESAANTQQQETAPAPTTPAPVQQEEPTGELPFEI